MPDDDDDLTIVAWAMDEMQAILIMGRLSEAGIRCTHTGAASLRRGMDGSRAVYVNAKDLERARAVLKEDEGGFDEDELARLSEEAGKDAGVDP